MMGVKTVLSGIYRAICVTSYLLVSLYVSVWGQEQAPTSRPSSLIHMALQDTLLEASNQELVGVVLMLKNKDTSQLITRLTTQVPPGLVWLHPGPQDTIALAPASKRYLTLRFRVTAAAKAGSEQLRIRLHQINPTSPQMGLSTASLLAETFLSVHIPENRAMQMHSMQVLKRMRFLNDSIQVPIQLRNTGNTDETIQLVGSLPNLTGSRRFQTEEYFVRAGSDTTVHMGFIADQELFPMEQFQFRIAGMYDDQAVFSNLSVTVQNASSARTFPGAADPGYSWGQRQNQLTLSSRNPLSAYQSTHLDAHMAFELPASKLELNTQLYQWGKLTETPILTNTWLSYTRGGMNVTMGNLMESAEKYINGRGARVSYRDSVADYELVVGAADKSHDLLNYYGRSNYGQGYSVFTKYQSGGIHPESGQKYAGTLLYDRDPFDNSESVVHAASFPLITRQGTSSTQLSMQLGAGLSRALTDTAGIHRTEPSMALGATFSRNLGDFYFNSHNYYSTAYYPGMQRGSLQLRQRVGMRRDMGNYWLSYDVFRFEPGSFIDRLPNYYLRTEQIELGATWTLGNSSTITLIPNRFLEENLLLHDIDEVTDPKVHLSSWRLKSMWQWRSQNNAHHSNLNIELARPSTSDREADPSWAYRATWAYNFWKLGLYVNYQNGYFSVYDVVSNLYHQQKDIYRMGGSLHFNHQSHARFRTHISLQYYQDSFFGSNESAHARVDWAVFPRTALFGSAQIHQYRNKQFGARNHTTVQVGISQSLAGLTTSQAGKKGNLQIITFYDHNRNGVFDEGDSLAPGKSILVDNSLFLTDSEGVMLYKKLPYGHYTIQTPVEQGWYAPTQVYLLDQRKNVLYIPLARSGTLTGQVVFDFDPRLSLSADIDLEGYTITARSHTGQVTQTRTNTQGEFMLFLPEGSFTVSINELEFPEHVYTEEKELSIDVEAAKLNKIPNFVLKVRERTIEVKRFGTPVDN